MTHYDVDYSELPPQTKHNKAIEDIKEYMGEGKYDSLTKEFRSYPPMSIDRFGMYLSIAGVSGYPVWAWYQEVWPHG